MRCVMACAAALILAGCQSSPFYRYSPEEAAAKCAEYGLPAGSVENARCQMQLEENRKAAVSRAASGALSRSH